MPQLECGSIFFAQQTADINLDEYWNCVELSDSIVKNNRNPNRKNSSGIYWPDHEYNGPEIYKMKFKNDGYKNKTCKEISEYLNNRHSSNKYTQEFVRGVINTINRFVRHPKNRPKWHNKQKLKVTNE